MNENELTIDVSWSIDSEKDGSEAGGKYGGMVKKGRGGLVQKGRDKRTLRWTGIKVKEINGRGGRGEERRRLRDRARGLRRRLTGGGRK